MADILIEGNDSGQIPASTHNRILIVDDEEINLKILRIYLEDKGYKVIAAQNGEDAINLLKSEDITACICDIRMPKISGIDVLNYIQQHKPIVPVIMLTGFIDINTAVSVMRQGARNYLTKPIDSGELIISVEKAIEYRRLVEDKQRLERENLEYQRGLENKVEKTSQTFHQSSMDIVVSLTNLIGERSKGLLGHSKRVAQYASMLGRKVGLDKEELNRLHTAAILHDLGKTILPDAVLFKKEALNDKEQLIYTTHAARGAGLLEPMGFLDTVADAVRHHHERWDGNGFPGNLSGENIPKLARFVHLVDAFDKFTSSTTDDQKQQIEDAVVFIDSETGRSFDPGLVGPFIELIQRMLEKIPKKPEPTVG